MKKINILSGNKINGWLIIILTLLVIILTACETPQEAIDSGRIVIYDECEYVMAKAPDGDYGWIMSHKGNCKNPIHK
jgi:hypothetical protein